MSEREYLPFVNALPRTEGYHPDDYPTVLVNGHPWQARVDASHGDALSHNDEDSGIHLTVRRSYYEPGSGFYWELWTKATTCAPMAKRPR
jgi:hypothetical protein